jgi:hypothetical protein
VVAVVTAAMLMGTAAGVAAYRVVAADQQAAEAARALDIQRQRWEAIAASYERSWNRDLKGAPVRVAITGTGPGLAWVADRQADWAGRVVTGTGPGLATLAAMQKGCSGFDEPTGTGGGLTHLCASDASDVILIGLP